jgi:hypothetical protein
MTSTRNWSINSFEKAMEYFIPTIKPDWSEYLNISPINYSEWSDTIYVEVHYVFTNEGMEIFSKLGPGDVDDFTFKFGSYLKKYVGLLLNTNILVKKFIRHDEVSIGHNRNLDNRVPSF